MGQRGPQWAPLANRNFHIGLIAEQMAPKTGTPHDGGMGGHGKERKIQTETGPYHTLLRYRIACPSEMHKRRTFTLRYQEYMPFGPNGRNSPKESPQTHKGPGAPILMTCAERLRQAQPQALLRPPAHAPPRSQPRRCGSLPGSAHWSRHACAARLHARRGTCRSH